MTMDDCVHDRLQSTIPPMTSTAWIDGLNGMSPGRTGIMNFTTDERNQSFVDTTSVNIPRGWDLVESKGENSAVLGVPLTYPVPEIDGITVSGLTSPSEGVRTFPTNLESNLPDGYRFFINYSEYDQNSRLLKELYASTNVKFDMSMDVLNNNVNRSKEPRTFIRFVLSELDWIQHYFRTHTSDRAFETGEGTVVEYLRHVDKRVGRILEMTSDRSVAIMSDHGFGKYTSRYIHLNSWLAQQGYLTRSPSAQDSSIRLQLIERVIQTVLQIPGTERLVQLMPRSLKDNIDISLGDVHVDPDVIDSLQTEARFRASVHASGHISVSNDIDNPSRLIDELIQGLSKLRGLHNEEKIIDEIYRG